MFPLWWAVEPAVFGVCLVCLSAHLALDERGVPAGLGSAVELAAAEL